MWLYDTESAGGCVMAGVGAVVVVTSGNAPIAGPHEKPTKKDSASCRRTDRGVVRRTESAGELPSSDD